MRKLHAEQAVGEKPSDYVRRSRQVFLALKLSNGDKVKDLARKAELSPSTIRNVRRPPNRGGTVFPRMQTILKILSAADATLEVVKDGQIIRKWN